MFSLVSSGKPRLFGFIFSSILLSSTTSQAHLPGFNQDSYIEQHRAHIEQKFDSQPDPSNGKSPISLEVLEKDALKEGRTWLYGLSSITVESSDDSGDSGDEKTLTIDLREVARINPEILDTFRKLLPEIDPKTREGKGLFYAFLQEWILASTYEVEPLAPLSWVEGVSPTFEWVEAVKKADSNTLAKYKGRAGYALFLQTQDRDRRLAETRKAYPGITPRHFWAIDIVSAQKQKESIQTITSWVTKADPNRFKSEDEVCGEYEKLPEEEKARKKALQTANSNDEKTGYMGRLQKLESIATSKKFTKELESTKGFTKKMRDFAIRDQISTIKTFITDKSNKIRAASLGRELANEIGLLESNVEYQLKYAFAYFDWLQGEDFELPINDLHDQTKVQFITVFESILSKSMQKLKDIEAWKPGNFLPKIVTRKLDLKENMSDDLFNPGITEVGEDLDLTSSSVKLTSQKAKAIIANKSSHIYEVSDFTPYQTKKYGAVKNKLNLGRQKGRPARYSSLFTLVDKTTGKPQFSFFVASRGTHTYVVYMDAESQPSSSSSATAKSSPSTASPKGRSTPHKGKGGGRRR